MKKILISFAIGLIIGISSAFLVYHFTKPMADETQKAKIITTQIAGEEIKHDNWSFKGQDIVFQTEAKGPGIIKTEIPKALIPEAASWMTKNQAIQIQFIYLVDLSIRPLSATPYLSVSYWHRFNSLSIGGGPVVALDYRTLKPLLNWGLNAGIMIWF